jgi:hypothetical protein
LWATLLVISVSLKSRASTTTKSAILTSRYKSDTMATAENAGYLYRLLGSSTSPMT